MSDDSTQPLTAAERVKKARKEADDCGQARWRDDAEQWYAFTSGEQLTDNERAELINGSRVPVAFNRIGPMVDSVSGSEVNNRQQVQYIPRTLGDKGLNEVLTGAADYVRDNCDAEDEESDAFVDSAICGIGCTETRLDYDEDPEGAVLIERRDPMSMRWDPGAKKRNLMDRRWQQYDAWLTREEIEAKWPDAQLDSVAGGTDTGDSSGADGSPHSSDRASFYAEREKSGHDKRNGRMRVTHHQWFETEQFHEVLNPLTGQVEQLDDREQLKVFQKRITAITGKPAEAAQKPRKRYMQAFVCGSVTLAEGPVPCNRFTFHFITGKRDRNQGTWYGIVKPMMDPQRWANSFLSLLHHIIRSNAKGGLLVEEDAVDDLDKFKANWSKADGVSVVNQGAISGGKVMPKPPPQVPPQLENLLQFSISSMRDVTGINLELLGMADRQQAGVLEAQRKQAAMTVLASLFDGLRRYRKEQGRTLAAFIAEYLTDGRLVRIVGGDGTEKYVALVRDDVAMRYDVVVDEAPASVNQKERTFALLMQMLPNLQQMGVPFAPDLLDYTPLPAAMVEKWKQVIQQQPQMDPRMVEQMQQANQQLQQQLQQAEAALRDKQAEIAAGLEEARVKSDADMQAKMQKAQVDAEATYQATIQKAAIDAQAAIDKAVVEGQAKVAVAQATAAATPPQQPTVVQIPEQKPDPKVGELGGAVEQLMAAFAQIAQQQADAGQLMEAMRAEVAKASRKPKKLIHARDPKTGFIAESTPVFD